MIYIRGGNVCNYDDQDEIQKEERERILGLFNNELKESEENSYDEN